MKILVDMNLSPLWVPFLNGWGFQALHWSGAGAASAPDAEILEYAATHGFVLFTHDLDFGMLLAARSAKAPSVIQVRTQDVLPEAIGETVVRAIDAARANLQAGALVSVDLGGHRVRLLPF
jgi:predicted nuclease of predicted toxin-antitoxin system